ncbi:MAG: invasion associated locus B family protein [Pseudomonadota bacterium]
MKHVLIAAVAGCLAATPVFSQNNDTTEQTDAAAQADAAFPVAQTAPNTPEPAAVFGEWEQRCVGEGDTEKCVLVQFGKTDEGEILSRLTIEALPEGAQAAAGLTIIAPLGVLLQAGMTLQIDDGRLNRYPFAVCERDGCLAQFGLTATEVEVMKAGELMRLGIVGAGSQEPIMLNISLDQFSEAWDALQAASE